jgi:DNA-binding FadR family transcriptional regulator
MIAAAPPKAARIVADALRQQILAGEYAPGDFLPSLDILLNEFGVSRPTMREALNQLEAGGLVRLRRGPGGGTQVRAPDTGEVVRALHALLQFERTSLVNVLEVRVVLEPTAARLASLRATAAELEELEHSLQRQKEPEVLENNNRWIEENYWFHSRIAYCAHNPVVRVLNDSLRDLILKAGHAASYTPTDRRRSIREHEEILRAVKARDGAGAEQALYVHLRHSIYVRKHIVEPADWGDALDKPRVKARRHD